MNNYMEGAKELILRGSFVVLRKLRSRNLSVFTGHCVLECFQLHATESPIETSLSKL